MAYLRTQPILTRLREVLEESAGALRTVPSGRFGGDDFEGLGEDARRVRALSVPRVEATITGSRKSPNSPPVNGNLIIREFDVTVRVHRVIATAEQLDGDERTELDALADADADVIAQALGWPSNLTTTAAGTATNIISGMLEWLGSSKATIGVIDEGAQTIETTHLFRGLARVDAAIS